MKFREIWVEPWMVFTWPGRILLSPIIVFVQLLWTFFLVLGLFMDCGYLVFARMFIANGVEEPND